jgi:hypothetical protein
MHATRRAVLIGSLAALAGPHAALAQTARLWRIAWLAPAPNPANLDAFRAGRAPAATSPASRSFRRS